MQEAFFPPAVFSAMRRHEYAAKQQQKEGYSHCVLAEAAAVQQLIEYWTAKLSKRALASRILPLNHHGHAEDSLLELHDNPQLD